MSENPKADKTPFYKKPWFWVVVAVLLILGFFYNLGQQAKDDSRTEDNQSQNDGSTEKTEDEPKDSTNKASGDDSIVCATNSVRNDVTGNWRIISVAEAISMNDKVVEYYKECFKDANEIHAIVNFTYKTTTKITFLSANNLVNVTTYEYVDGEEHDAKKLFSGMVLTDKFYDANTGEEVSLE